MVRHAVRSLLGLAPVANLAVAVAAALALAACGSSGSTPPAGNDNPGTPDATEEAGVDDVTGEPGTEVTPCTSECNVEGAIACEPNGAGFRTCLDQDGCLAWSADPTPCDAGQKCTDGECRDACPDQPCTAVGARRCKDAGAFWQCGDYDGDGCLEWGDETACDGGLVCSNGFCSTSCQDACTTAGAKKCEGNDVVTCGDHDSNGCLEWGDARSCGTQSCSGGFCKDQCQDDCTTVGARHCDGNGWAVCDNSDRDPCLEWGTVTPCLPDESCANGYCVMECKDACTVEGAKKCVLDAVATCTDTNDDGCREWTTPDPCEDGFSCNAGVCEEVCKSECTQKGAKKCDEAGAVIECVDPAGDGCLKWGSPVPCEQPLVCALGECKLGCEDECPGDGDKRCAEGTTNQFQTCGDSDQDGCLEWGTASACDGALVCSGGSCVTTCSDVCDPDGVKGCDQNGWHQCGDWNDDGCLEWGTTTFCKDYEECDGTACVAKTAPHIVLISEVLYDGEGTDKDSFVELWGPPGASLAGYSLVGVNGNGGDLYNAISLSGKSIGDDGFFVIAYPEAMESIRNAADLLDVKVEYQNGPDSIQVRFGSQVVDAFAYGTFGAGAVMAGEGTPAPKVSKAGHSQGRNEDESDTDDNLSDFLEFATPTPGAPNVVPNLPPVAQVACPAPALVGNEVEFDATASHDPDGDVTWWVFDFGDGEQHEGETGSVTHTYTAAGSYLVTITVSDDDDATAKTTCNLTISTPENKPPVAAITCPGASPKAGEQAAFDASASTDPDGTIAEYSFAFGDGSGATGASANATHAYADAGEYVVVVTVKDDDGATGTAQCYVKVASAGAPDRIISASQELCGYHEFGKLTIQGGATVTCATGELDVRATEVLIDPASKIDVSATSSSYSGGGYNFCSGGSCTCNYGYTGGSGGGNGTAGGIAPSTHGSARDYIGWCAGSCVGFGCAGAAGGSQRGLATELDAPLGGAGGTGCKSGFSSCSTPSQGGRGGGSVRILASKSIMVQGGILANATGGTDGMSGSGGGAGGSIVLAAPSLSLTGTLSADGGAGSTGGTPSVWSGKANGGAGGMGWVKLCHGATYTNTAAISASAVKVESVMPPLDVSSTTHPDSKLVYNDTFSQLDMAWKTPFSGVTGYWYALNQGSTFALTPANGTYTADLSKSFTAADFGGKAGQWYFRVVAVDSTAVAGTVAWRYDVYVNDKPHEVASSSHADPSKWYAGKAIALAWTPPSPATVGSFPAFWYRLDRVSDTSPANAKAQWTRTTNAQVVLTADSTGAPIDAFAYHFHLVAEDTRGNLTRAAARFRVQIGAEPAKMNFFGYVKDAGGNAVAGATVRMEPYGHQATTDQNGYFILNQIHEGPYVLTARKTGYADATANVTVKSDAVPFNVTVTAL